MVIKLDDFYYKPAVELLKLSDKDLKEAKRLTELLLRCVNTLARQKDKICQFPKLSVAINTNVDQSSVTEPKGD